MSKKDQEATPSPSIPSPNSIMAFSSTTSSLNTPTSAHPIAHDDIDLKIAEFKKNWITGGHQGPEAMHGCHEYLTFNPRQWGLKDRPARERSPSVGGAIHNDINSLKLDWVVPICPPTITGWAAGTQIPHMSSREKGTPVTTSHPNGNIRPHFYYSPPSPPFTQLHKYLEEFEKLPSMPSPTLPPWPTPARSVTGGKQPGKVPNVPLNLASSDDSSDSGSDSDSSEPESENVATSDGDGSSRQRKSIGRKTAQRRNSKSEVGGKRPAGTTSGKAVPESTRPYSKDLKARKTSKSQFCTILNDKQVSDMVRRFTASGLSRSPVVVKINIPSFAKSSSRLTEKSRTSPKTRPPTQAAPSSKFNSPSSRRRGDDSSSDEDRDRKGNGNNNNNSGNSSRHPSKELSKKQDAKYADGRSKRSRSHTPEISESEDRRKGRTKAKDSRKRDEDKDMFYDDDHALSVRSPRPSDSPISKRKSVDSPSMGHVDSKRGVESRSKRVRSYSPDSSGSDDKRHPRARSRDRDSVNTKDSKLGIKSPFPTKSPATKSPPEPKNKQPPPPVDSSFTDAKRHSISTGSSRLDKGMADRIEKNGTNHSKGRTKDTQSLSPISERPKDRNRQIGHHSTDEADAEETIKRRRREGSDEPKSRSQAVSALEIRSRIDSGSKEIKSESTLMAKKRSDSRDRSSKEADSRRNGKDTDGNARETKDKTDRPLPLSAKERRVSKDDDGTPAIPFNRAGTSKNDSKSDRTGSSAGAPLSPRDRTNRDGNKETKPRTDKDSRDDTSHRSTTGTKDRDRSTKDRARGRSRSRTRSRSPRGRYDRNRGSPVGRDAKGNRDRRDYDDDRSSRRKTGSRQRDNSRDRNDRGRVRSRDRFARDRSRDRSRERSPSRDKKRRSRSRERVDGRKDMDRRARDRSASPISARSDSRLNQADSSKSSAGGRRESESKHGASSSVSSNSLRRPSHAVIKEEGAAAAVAPPTGPTSTAGSVVTPSSAPASDSSRQEGLARSTSSNSLTATPTVKRMSIEDYQRKRVQVDTPKAADSPALSSATVLITKSSSGTATKLQSTELKPSSSNGSSSSSGADSAPAKPTIRPEVAEKIAQYFNTYRVRRAKGVTYKHSADDNFKKKSEQKLSAIQYFLSTIEFIAAFHANDKYHSLSNPGRPDIAVKESITSWETMRQFINSLTLQCHTNGLLGLDGLSALLEVLVCFKVYSYHTATLRKEMHKMGHFEPAALVGKDDVAVSTDLAGRLLKNVDDWAQIQKRMDDCRNWLTPDVARLTFPESFRRWCIHPDQIGSTTSPFERTVGNTGIQKIIWPLGTHIHLHELMGFVDAALTEYQRRTGLRDPGLSH